MKIKLLLKLGFLLFFVLGLQDHVRAAGGERLTKLAPPTNIRVEAGKNVIKVIWDASTDQASYMLAGYNIYFSEEALALLAPNQLPVAVQVGKGLNECLVRGLENDRHYFFQVRSRNNEGDISVASQLETKTAPLSEGKNYPLVMYDDGRATSAYNSGYGWSRKNGQELPGYHDVKQHGKYVDLLMLESSSAKQYSLFTSPAEAASTERWPMRNRTLIADIGMGWLTTAVLPDSAFATQAVIKPGHVYVLKTSDNYYLKLRVDTCAEINMLLPLGEEQRSATLNKITFTYVAQLGQSYKYFLTGKP